MSVVERIGAFSYFVLVVGHIRSVESCAWRFKAFNFQYLNLKSYKETLPGIIHRGFCSDLLGRLVLRPKWPVVVILRATVLIWPRRLILISTTVRWDQNKSSHSNLGASRFERFMLAIPLNWSDRARVPSQLVLPTQISKKQKSRDSNTLNNLWSQLRHGAYCQAS